MFDPMKKMEGSTVASPRSRAKYGLAGLVATGALAIGLFAGVSALPSVPENAIAEEATIAQIDGDISLAEKVAAKCLPSVGTVYVKVETLTTRGVSMGSCVVIDESGVIVTNYHVVDGASSIQVTLNGVTYEAELMGSDPTSDIAVLKIDPGENKLAAIALGSSSDLNVGQWVMTIGSPKGESESVSQGIVSGLNRTYSTSLDTSQTNLYYVGLIQSDAMINSGSSGGAMVNANGELIGITTLNATSDGDFAGMSYAIPVDYVKNIVTQIEETGTVAHPIIGTITMPISYAYYNGYYNINDDSPMYGAYIYEVVEGGGAQAAGIEPGDVVIGINGNDVSTPSDFILGIRQHAIGDTVTVKVYRDGENKEFEVTLGSDLDVDADSLEDEANNQENTQGQRHNGKQNQDGSEQGEDEQQYSEGISLYDIINALGLGDTFGYGGGNGYGNYGYGNGNDYGYYGYYGYPGYNYGYPGYVYVYPGYGYGYPGYGYGYVNPGNGQGQYYGYGNEGSQGNDGAQGYGNGNRSDSNSDGFQQFIQELREALGM